MILVLIRSIILYIVILIALRIMGKGEIAEMNVFDLVITLLIAEVASFPMENSDIPIINAISSVTGLVFVQIIISYISTKSRTIRTFLCGSPSILIDKGKINYKEMKKQRITIDELLEQLRIEGYFKLQDVQYAILEVDGNLSVLPSPLYKDIPTKYFKHLPISVILDGNIIKNNLKLIKKDINWLNSILNSNKIKDISEVLILSVDENNKIFIQKR